MYFFFQLFYNAAIETNQNKQGDAEVEEEDWEDASEDECEEDDQIKAPEKFTQQKDALLLEQFPVDDVKMVLVVRTDLGMQKGKMAA